MYNGFCLLHRKKLTKYLKYNSDFLLHLSIYMLNKNIIHDFIECLFTFYHVLRRIVKGGYWMHGKAFFTIACPSLLSV